MTEETLTVYRGETDRYGNPNKAASGTVKGVFAWQSGTRRDRNLAKGEGAVQVAELYVKRGSDVRARDRLHRANGQVFAVIGVPTWDQVDPFGGYDFGYMVLQVEAVNG